MFVTILPFWDIVQLIAGLVSSFADVFLYIIAFTQRKGFNTRKGDVDTNNFKHNTITYSFFKSIET
jgi:hypothetical protein